MERRFEVVFGKYFVWKNYTQGDDSFEEITTGEQIPLRETTCITNDEITSFSRSFHSSSWWLSIPPPHTTLQAKEDELKTLLRTRRSNSIMEGKYISPRNKSTDFQTNRKGDRDLTRHIIDMKETKFFEWNNLLYRLVQCKVFCKLVNCMSHCEWHGKFSPN